MRHEIQVAAVIPARGGSKGIPRKNLSRIGGRSLVARSIHAALGCDAIDAVYVSTEDESIKAEARRHGGTVIVRPRELADDKASSESALLHALDHLAASGTEPEIVAFVQCTSPFTRAEDIAAVIAPVVEGRAESAFSASRFHGFLWASGDGETFTGINHDATRPRQRRQDRPTELLESGAVYVFRSQGFRQAGSRFFGRIEPIELSADRALEIDQPLDLELARGLAAHLDPPPPARLLNTPPELVVLDFDGVLTDNTVLVMQDGSEGVICHRGDGHGLAKLRQLVPVVVLSTELNPVVAARCAKLNIHCEHGLGDTKAASLARRAAELGIDLGSVLYVGNDVNDLECLKIVGTAVAVADAVPEVLDISDIVLSRTGGHGAIRELCDWLAPIYERTENHETP